MRSFTAVVERCPDTGFYVGYVPGFPGARSQGESLEELNRNLKEVIELLLEDGRATARSRVCRHAKRGGGLAMGDTPVLKPSEVIAILEAMGFFEARQRGGHKQFRHADGRGTTVSFPPRP